MASLEKIIDVLNKALMGIAGFFVAAMVVMACANIFLRLVWVPLSGTFELMGYFGAVATAFALGATQIKRGHVAVDIVVQRFSRKTRKALSGVNCLVCTAFFALVAWQIIRYGVNLLRTGEVTETLRIVYYPFAFAVALGCGVLSLVFLTDFLRLLLPAGVGEK